MSNYTKYDELCSLALVLNSAADFSIDEMRSKLLPEQVAKLERVLVYMDSLDDPQQISLEKIESRFLSVLDELDI